MTIIHRNQASLVARGQATARTALAELRWQRETGGVTLPDGTVLQTTRDAQAQIANAVQASALGLVAFPLPWKAATGWVDLTDQVVLRTVAAIVAGHVAACFRAEKAVDQQIEIGRVENLAAAFDTAYAAAVARQ